MREDVNAGLIRAYVTERLADGRLQRILGESAIAGEIYRERLADVAAQVRQLAAVNDFLAGRGLPWAPPGEAR